MSYIKNGLIFFILISIIPLCFALPSPSNGTTSLVSITSLDIPADSQSYHPSISGDSRYIAFESAAPNLNQFRIKGDMQIFLHDRNTGITNLVSHDPLGYLANGHSFSPSISLDGNFVAFTSTADNIDDGDTNGCADIFVWDRLKDQVFRVSTDSGGNVSNGPSKDPKLCENGSFVVFSSWATNLVKNDNNKVSDIFRKDIKTGVIDMVSSASSDQGNGDSYHPAISGNGEIIAFDSFASNLISGDNNGKGDIFIKNLQSGNITQVSNLSDGTVSDGHSGNPSLDYSGLLVAFSSQAHNLGGSNPGFNAVYFKNITSGILTPIPKVYEDLIIGSSIISQGSSSSPVLSDDGNFLAFQTEMIETTKGFSQISQNIGDIILYNLSDATVQKVSVRTNGQDGEGGISSSPSISAEGKAIVFSSDDLMLSDKKSLFSSIYIHQLPDPWLTPEIFSIKPSSGVVNSNITVNISGNNLFGGEKVEFIFSDTEKMEKIGVMRDNILMIDGVNLTDATPGTWSVQVTNLSSGKFCIFSNSFEVLPLKTYFINASADDGGAINPSGQIPVIEGENQSFTISPNFSYAINSLLVDNSPLQPMDNYTFFNISENHTITAKFSIDPNTKPMIFKVDPISGIPGSILSCSITGDYFSSIAGFRLNSSNHTDIVATNISVISKNQIRGLLNISSDVDCGMWNLIVDQGTAHSDPYPFILHSSEKYVIDAESDNLGWLKPDGVFEVTNGSNKTFTFKPTAGATFENLQVNGDTVTDVSNFSYVLNNINQDYVIRLNNKPIPGVVIAGFSVTYTNDPLTVGFNDISRSDIPLLKWRWDFGDGTQSTELNPFHTYSQAGTYVVSFCARTNISQSQEIKGIIVVPPGEEQVLVQNFY